MNLCELRPAEGSRGKTGDAAEVMQQAMAKQPAEAIKVPVSVPVQAANAALKAARCLCTEDFLREASHAETAKKLLQSTFPC